jgi:hypothetical protein
MERIPRPRRGQDDGLTVMQRAQELQKIKKSRKGKPNKSFAFKSNFELLLTAQCVNISLGIDTLESEKIIENLKQKEIINIDQFEENNPKVNLPGELSVEDLVAECTTVNAENQTPLKEDNDLVNQTWAQVVSTGKTQTKKPEVNNDRSFLEH